MFFRRKKERKKIGVEDVGLMFYDFLKNFDKDIQITLLRRFITRDDKGKITKTEEKEVTHNALYWIPILLQEILMELKNINKK